MDTPRKPTDSDNGDSYLKRKWAPYKEVIDSTPAVRQHDLDEKRADDPAFYNKRRKGSDRTDLLKPDNTRNVHYTSSMPGAPGSKPGLVDTNQENPHKPQYQITEEAYKSQGVGSEYRGGTAIKKGLVDESGVRDVNIEGQSQKSMGLVQSRVRTISRRTKVRKKLGKKAPLAKMRVKFINRMILAWGLPLWATFQIPFAIFNIVFFGLMAAVSAVMTTNSDDSTLTVLAKTVAVGFLSALAWVADKIKDFTGWDPGALNPGNFWALTEMVMFGYTIIIIFLMYIQYKVALLNPLSGKGEAGKYGALIFMIFGYLIPILNLFPWFLIWLFAVGRNPK